MQPRNKSIYKKSLFSFFIDANIIIKQNRISKLKTLLARTHQANQRNLEEFGNLKRAQREAEDELRQSEEKNNAELTTLREAVRAQSITSAFQYDVDILIQRAADNMFAQQQLQQHKHVQQNIVGHGDLSANLLTPSEPIVQSCEKVLIESSNERVRYLETELADCQEKMEKMQLTIIEEKQAREELKVQYMSEKAYVRQLSSELQDQTCLRRELELELNSLLVDRVQRLSDRQIVEKVTVEAKELRSMLEVEQKKRRSAEQSIDRLTKETHMLAVKCQDFTNVQKENLKLDRLLQEFKSSRPKLGQTKNLNLDNHILIPEGERKLCDLRESVAAFKSHIDESAADTFDFFERIKGRAELQGKLANIMGRISEFVALFLTSVRTVTCTLDSSFAEELSLGKASDEDCISKCLERIQYVSQHAVAERESIKKKIESTPDCSTQQEVVVSEASSVVIKPGQCIMLPVLGVSEELNPCLEWRYSGEGCDCIALSLAETGNQNSVGFPLTSISSQEDAKIMYSGSTSIPSKSNNAEGFAMQILNRASWANAIIAYTVKIRNQKIDNSFRISLLSLKEKIEKKTALIGCILDQASIILLQIEQTKNLFSKGLPFPHKFPPEIFLKLSSNTHKILHRVDFIRSGSCKFSEIESKFLEVENEANQQISVPTEVVSPVVITNSAVDISVYSAESVTIQPANDFRICIPPYRGIVRISWDFNVEAGTIGFAIGKRVSNGTLPVMVSYRRTKEAKGVSAQAPTVGLELFDFGSEIVSLVIVFDNNFSWFMPKKLRYCITVEIFSPQPAVISNLMIQTDSESFKAPLDLAMYENESGSSADNESGTDVKFNSNGKQDNDLCSLGSIITDAELQLEKMHEYISSFNSFICGNLL